MPTDRHVRYRGRGPAPGCVRSETRSRRWPSRSSEPRAPGHRRPARRPGPAPPRRRPQHPPRPRSRRLSTPVLMRHAPVVVSVGIDGHRPTPMTRAGQARSRHMRTSTPPTPAIASQRTARVRRAPVIALAGDRHGDRHRVLPDRRPDRHRRGCHGEQPLLRLARRRHRDLLGQQRTGTAREPRRGYEQPGTGRRARPRRDHRDQCREVPHLRGRGLGHGVVLGRQLLRPARRRHHHRSSQPGEGAGSRLDVGRRRATCTRAA